MKNTLSVLLIISALVLGACQPATAMPTQVPTETPAPAATETLVPTETASPLPTETETPLPPTATSTPAFVPDASLTGSVRVITWDRDEEPWKQAIASFQAAYPNVKLEFRSIPQGYAAAFENEYNAGGGADVLQIVDGDLSRFAEAGMLEPLNPYLSGEVGKEPLDMSVFFSGIASSGQVGETTYALTRDFTPITFYYNKKLFDAAGVAYPTEAWTWDDFLTAAQALTIKDESGKVTQWGFSIRDGAGNVYWQRALWPFIYQNGGDLISPDGKKTSGYLDSDATVQALQWYADLFTKHKVAPTQADINNEGRADLFAKGKAAMQFTGAWELWNYMNNTEISVGTAQMPQGVQRGTSLTWRGFAINSKSKNKQAAWAFVRWVGAGDGAVPFANYGITAVKSIAAAQGKLTDPYMGPVLADADFTHPVPYNASASFYGCAGSALEEYIKAYIAGGGDLKAELAEIAAKGDTCLAR